MLIVLSARLWALLHPTDRSKRDARRQSPANQALGFALALRVFGSEQCARKADSANVRKVGGERAR